MAARAVWPVLAAVFGAAALAAAYAYGGKSGIPGGPAYLALSCLGGMWAGALVGGLVDWIRTRRSPLAPVFPSRFQGYYRLGLWLRFAVIFASGWLISALFAGVFIVIVGSPDEVAALFSVSGLLAILIMGIVYAVLGAVIGGLVRLAGVVFGGGE